MWGKFLASRWCIPVAALFGMLLVAPAMNIGLMGDDYLHWSLLTGRTNNPQPGSFFGLFTFANGNPHANQLDIDSGKLVWWASDTLRIAFWRPLAELSQWLDYRLWPDSPVAMHLHSLVLYGLMIVLIGQLFRELDPDPQQSGLATVLFAGNMLHAFAVAWLACRNQMLSGIFLALTLLSYHRWRQGRSPGYALAAGLSLALGLLSAEASVQIAAYLVAYAVFIDPAKSMTARIKAIAPFLIMVLVWKATHGHLGYGSFGSPGYVDPASNLGRFGASLVLRLPALMLAQWFGVSSVMFEQLDHGTQAVYAGAGAVALLGLVWVIYLLGGFRSALVRFYGAASILALIPACAGFPFDRLTVNSDLGASGLLAVMTWSVWRQRHQLKGWGAGSAKNIMLLVGGIHLFIFPVAKMASSVMMGPLMAAGEALGALAIPDADPAQTQHYLLVNSASAEGIYYIPLIRQYHGMHNPTTMRALGPNNQAMTLTRLDEVSLRMSVPTGFRGTITRDIQLQPFKPGDTAHMGDISVQVEEITADRAPKTVVFRFPSSLDMAQWHFLAWKESGVYQIKPPAPGQSVSLAAYDISQAVMRQLHEAHEAHDKK
jgi:hypothetical protein